MATMPLTPDEKLELIHRLIQEQGGIINNLTDIVDNLREDVESLNGRMSELERNS